MKPLDISNFMPQTISKERDIEQVTGELLKLKRQAGNTMIAIGQRLIEAKEMLPHGEWLPWLRDRVEFSERMAQQLMQLAREMSNPQTFADLEPSKVLALLAVPAEEREAFASRPHNVAGEEKTIKDMSVREIKEAIKEEKRPSCSETQCNSAERSEDAALVQPKEPERCEISEEVKNYTERYERDNEKFLETMEFFAKKLAKAIDFEGFSYRNKCIEALAKQFGENYGGSYEDGLYDFGVTRMSILPDEPEYGRIERTWTEVWDILALYAVKRLNSTCENKNQPEGQLVICGWMPGGTYPREPGDVVAAFDFGDGVILRKICYYADGQYFFKKSGAVIDAKCVKWLQLPQDE